MDHGTQANERSPRRDGSSSHAVRLVIPAKAEYIALVRLALSGLARAHEFSEETLADLKLAVTEACSNAVRHAYDAGGEGPVEVVYEAAHDRLVVEVADSGGGFDPAGRGVGGASELNEGGLGIAIIREIADELEIGGGPGGKGSKLRFVKTIAG